MDMKPHGLEVFHSEEIMDGSITRQNVAQDISQIEAYIDIKNSNNGKEVTLPMRSFLNNFINALHGILSGDGGSDTLKATVDVDSGASTSKRAGMLIGHGQNGVVLSDSDLQTPATHASIAYGDTTLVAPYVISNNPNRLGFAVQRMFTNNKYTDIVLSELVLKTKRVSSSVASNAGNTIISRDNLYPSTGESGTKGVIVSFSNGIQFQFRFNVYQGITGVGGVVLNFARLIYNLMFAGNQNASALINTSNNAIPMSYGSGASVGDGGTTTVDSEAVDTEYGILVGYFNEERDNPEVSADDTTFNVVSGNLTYGATVISAVSNPESGVARFTVTRDITNSSSQVVYLDRGGLKIKAGAFIAINRLNNNSYLELAPNQILRLSYQIQIRA